MRLYLITYTFLTILLQSLTVAKNTSSFPSAKDDEEIFRMMFDAQDRYRQDNYLKLARDFEVDWEQCSERYRWPVCCLWSEKKNFKRGTSECRHIKGDVILDNNHDANLFQSFINLREIQGSLVLRNTSILAFGFPNLRKIGFNDTLTGHDRPKASLIIENNKYLFQIRLRRLEKIAKSNWQEYVIFRNNPKLRVDARQYEILKRASNRQAKIEKYKPPTDRYVRSLLYELWPYFLFGIMIIVVFTHHFIMLEVNESRVKSKEQEMVDCMVKMRDSTLAAELLLQTPNDVTLAFDTNVLHLCTDQAELIKQIEKLLNADMKAFKDSSLEEVSAKEGTYET